MRLITTLRRRSSAEAGFTLIELLVVLVIIAVLISIAVPAYLGFKDRAADRAAQANLRTALAAAEAYYSDNITYVGMTDVTLRLSYDAGLSSTLRVVSAGPSSYCITETVSGKVWSLSGPGTPAPSFVPNATCS
jgi:prepilin-type N-terminal cleavage/methylation domain-containing protein